MTRGLRAGIDPEQKEKTEAAIYRMIRQGKSVNEVAQALNVTPSRIHQRLHSHRQRMQGDIRRLDDRQFEVAYGLTKQEFLYAAQEARQAAAAWLAQESVQQRLVSPDPHICDKAVYEARKHGCTLQQIADIIGVSRARIAQRERAHESRIAVVSQSPDSSPALYTPGWGVYNPGCTVKSDR